MYSIPTVRQSSPLIVCPSCGREDSLCPESSRSRRSRAPVVIPFSEECEEDLKDLGETPRAKKARSDASGLPSQEPSSLSHNLVRVPSVDTTGPPPNLKDLSDPTDTDRYGVNSFIGESAVVLQEFSSSHSTNGGYNSVLPKQIGQTLPSGPLASSEHTTLVVQMKQIKYESGQKAFQIAHNLIEDDSKIKSLDLRLAAIQAVIPPYKESIPILKKALILCDSERCTNPVILKCRINYEIAFCYYRNNFIKMARKHGMAALELSKQISQDFGPILAQLFVAIKEHNVMVFLPFELSKVQLESLDKWPENTLGLIASMPDWIRDITTTVHLQCVLLKMVSASHYMEHEKQKALLCADVGQELLDRVNKNLRKVESAYFYCTKMYQSKVREKHDQVQQFGYQAVHYLEGCGRMQYAFEVKRLLQRLAFGSA